MVAPAGSGMYIPAEALDLSELKRRIERKDKGRETTYRVNAAQLLVQKPRQGKLPLPTVARLNALLDLVFDLLQREEAKD